MKNNGGLNSKTFSNSCSLKRKTHFPDFLAIFLSHLSSKILIFEKILFTTAVSIPKIFNMAPYLPPLKNVDPPYCTIVQSVCYYFKTIVNMQMLTKAISQTPTGCHTEEQNKGMQCFIKRVNFFCIQ